MIRTVVATCVALLLLAACGTGRPAHLRKFHGLGGSSLVYVEPLEHEKASRVGRSVPVTAGELASQFRIRLLQRLREKGLQTRDATGSIPKDGILVRGAIETIDGGPSDGLRVGGQRIHCRIELWNGATDRSDPAAELRVTGTPDMTDVTSDSAGLLGAADDCADQVVKYIRENP